MHRPVILTALMLCVSLAASAQTPRGWGPGSQGRVIEEDRPERAGTKPPESIPVQRRALQLVLPSGLTAEAVVAPSDSLSEEEVMRRISRLYRYQSDILAAQVQEDNGKAEELLDQAMSELAALIREDGVRELPRFQELYRSLVTEYEAYYGVAPEELGIAYGDVFDLRNELFSALNEVDEPLLEDVTRMPIQPMATVIPMTVNRLVDQSIAYLLRQPEKHMYRWLSRAETYFPMIEQILREEGVPDELKYLAMIESGLNPHAQSWAQAVGMWQFIAATGRRYDLTINSWVDDRRDPEKATRAAAQHLRDLYATYDDWQLALAAYNCGPGNVNRALRRLGRQKATFWEIWDYLPKETRSYVPMFIATSLVASNPSAFGLRSVEPGPRYEYDYVPVTGSLALSTVARLAQTDVETIRALNPALRKSALPPSKEPYYVRIPIGTYARFAAEFANVPVQERQVASADYVVRRGDTLSKIARQHSVSLSELMSENNLRRTTIRVGQRLVIPGSGYNQEVEPAQLASLKPITVQYGQRMVNPITADQGVQLASASGPQAAVTPVVNASERTAVRTTSTPAPREVESSSDTRVVYTVRRGDTLGKIASRYGVRVRDLQSWNGIRGSTIRSGQRIKIYSDREPAAEAAPAPKTVTHRVQRGENLTAIANRYGVSVNDIRAWNGLSGSRIMVGQRLKINAGSESAPTTITHRVKRGDTLAEIAQQYGVTIANIKSWNNLRTNTIRVGQRLKIHS